MAAEQMKKVTGHLTCPICYELYKKPKYLPCYHSYCEECLEKLVVQSNITCPECRKMSDVPSGGVEKLPNNFFINRLLDEVAKAKYAMCQKHELELNFYCETCDQLVCHYCIMKDHLKHDHDTVKEMAVKHRKELDKIMEPVGKMIEGLSVACKKISNMRDKIGAQADDIDKEIDRYYDKLHRRLQQQRDELKKELHEASKLKRKEVTLQLEQMQNTQAQLESIKDLNSAMKKGSDQETLLIKKQMIDDVKRISDGCNKLDTQPVQLATMKFVPLERYRKSLPQFGYLSYSDVCPGNSEALNIPKMTAKGERVSFKVVTKDQNGQPCQKGGSQVIIQARSNRGDVTPVEVKDNKDGSYSALFVANQIGEIKLSVTIKGQGIVGSPFIVKVHGNYNTIDKPSKVVNEGGWMGAPCGIAFGRHGMWAVTDAINHCVWIFDGEDQLVKKFGSYGTGYGQFNVPFGIAFDANNHLYVAEYINHRVQKFDIGGKSMLSFGTHGSNNGHLNHPLGITVHNDIVYVTESRGGKRISVFQLDGHFNHIIGSGHLSNPHYIAVNTNDQLLVADCDHHSVFMFTLDGKYVCKFGTQGTGRGQLNCPSGIATDNCGFILVSERGSDRLSIFGQNGVFIHCFGSKGSGHGQFSKPRQIAISPTGDIYICDMGNKRIQIFSPGL